MSLPEHPITRTEQYLDYIAKNGSGGSGGNVPDPEVADIGKVLGIVEDGTGAKYAPVAGSGLPDPSAITDGTAMVAVNGEWKMQEGYGYTGEPAFEPIEWDGETEGRASFATFYKVSDAIIPADNIIGATMVAIEGEEEFSVAVSSVTEGDGVYYDNSGLIYVISGAPLEFPYIGTATENGVYFYSAEGSFVKSLTAPASVHQFDSALIPGVIPAAPSEDGAYVLTCTITDGEAVYSWETNA